MIQRHEHTQRLRRGFSLIEVMIALVVLAFGLLTLATMQIHALKQGSAGRHTGDASAIARSYVEQMQRVDWAVLTTALNDGADSNLFWADASDSFDVHMTDLAGDDATERSYDVRLTVSDVTTCLRDVEIKVLWTEDGRAAQKNLRLATRRYNWGAPGC